MTTQVMKDFLASVWHGKEEGVFYWLTYSIYNHWKNCRQEYHKHFRSAKARSRFIRRMNRKILSFHVEDKWTHGQAKVEEVSNGTN